MYISLTTLIRRVGPVTASRGVFTLQTRPYRWVVTRCCISRRNMEEEEKRKKIKQRRRCGERTASPVVLSARCKVCAYWRVAVGSGTYNEGMVGDQTRRSAVPPCWETLILQQSKSVHIVTHRKADRSAFCIFHFSYLHFSPSLATSPDDNDMRVHRHPPEMSWPSHLGHPRPPE